MLTKMIRYTLIAVCAGSLAACYIVQPAPGSDVMIQGNR